MCSVADELIFDQLLESQTPANRASVERVLAMRGYGSRVTDRDLDEAREEGYHRGLARGRAESKADKPETPDKPVTP